MTTSRIVEDVVILRKQRGIGNITIGEGKLEFEQASFRVLWSADLAGLLSILANRVPPPGQQIDSHRDFFRCNSLFSWLSERVPD
jgi:hypothetical protein